ncbi:hypothetical protein Tco_0561661 [Tanacetum coccineum]
MDVLESCPKHNMVTYLVKTDGNAEFHEIIDFLTRSSIHYTLTRMRVKGGSERPSKPQPTPLSSSRPSGSPMLEATIYPSPGPLPTIPILDPNLEGSGGNLGSQTSSDKSLSGTWLRIVKRKNQHKKKVLKTSKRRSIFKQGRKTVKSSKGAPTVPTNTEWDDLDMDIDDTKDYTLAQDEGKTDKVDEKRENGTAKPEPRESTSSASSNNSNTYYQPTFGDDTTIAQVLPKAYQAKAVSKEKEKGVEIRNAENAERPRTTSTRSVLTLKPLPKINPNDKGKKRFEEDEESDTEFEEITEAKKKFDQIAHDEEVARKIQEEWEAEKERKKLTEKEATKTALSNEYDFIQARIEADRLLAERVQEAEREQFTVEERAKFLHDTIATQKRILAQQRLEAIENKPPTKNQFRNQMMTYLKHVGNKKHADLKTKSFDEIKALYEKVKRFDDSFITIGSTEDERKIKEMNEGASDPDRERFCQEYVSTKVTCKSKISKQRYKKRKSGHMKMIARKRKRPQPDVDSDDEHRKCLKIVTFEGEVIEKLRTRDDELDTGINDYPSHCDYDKKNHIDCAHNLKFSCMIGFEFTHANFFPLLYVNVMSKKFHNSIMKDKMVYKGNNVIGALMNVPIFVGTFSVVTDFAVLENMDAYRDERMGDVIIGEPFLREVGIKTRWFDGMITIYNGNDEVT